MCGTEDMDEIMRKFHRIVSFAIANPFIRTPTFYLTDRASFYRLSYML